MSAITTVPEENKIVRNPYKAEEEAILYRLECLKEASRLLAPDSGWTASDVVDAAKMYENYILNKTN
jgi:hypothetical protein